MKKYIRTKDERIGKVTHEDNKNYRANFGRKCPLVSKEEVIESADTIEKLCDEFRGIWINYYESKKKDAHEEYHYDDERGIFYDDFEELTPKEAVEKFDIFYGAIWTDKGLIYVAKMNEKGEFELL